MREIESIKYCPPSVEYIMKLPPSLPKTTTVDCSYCNNSSVGEFLEQIDFRSSSNWILRVTSGQSNSGHKQIHISKVFSHMYQPSVKSIYKTNHRITVYTRMKTESAEQRPAAMQALN